MAVGEGRGVHIILAAAGLQSMQSISKILARPVPRAGPFAPMTDLVIDRHMVYFQARPTPLFLHLILIRQRQEGTPTPVRSDLHDMAMAVVDTV